MTRRFHPSRRHHTGRGGRDDPGAHAPRGYRSALEQHLDARAQQERARRWRPQDTLKLARVISKLAPYKLREKHERILASHSLGRAHIHEALRMIYAHADWFELRVLLAQLGERRHAALVPVLAELASAASAFTRLLVVQTCGRIGHPAVEPLLLALCARREDRGVRVASLQVLALLGTPRAVRALGEVAQDPGVGLEAKRTVEAILARYPDVDFAPAGALTIADHSVAGALELARLGDGELALYEAGERAVRRVSKNKPGVGEVAQGTPSPSQLELAWHNMALAPRPVPWPVWVEALGWGRRGEAQIGWALVGIWGSGLAPSGWPLALGVALVVAGVVRSVGSLRTWRSGVPSFARLVRHDPPTQAQPGLAAVKEHTYVFEYLGLDGKPYRLERTRSSAREAWQGGGRVLEPMLYLPGPADDEDHERATLAREMISTLVLARDGRWRAAPRVVAMVSGVPLIALAMALLRVLG